jgi:hypothetical protein
MSRCFSFLYSKKKEKDLFYSAFINPLISLKDWHFSFMHAFRSVYQRAIKLVSESGARCV